MKTSWGNRLLARLTLLGLAVTATASLGAPAPASAAPAAPAAPDTPTQTGSCTPAPTTDFAATGPFAVTTQSDAVTTFYFPSQLGTQGCTRHPVILWGNGTITAPSWYDALLRHLASHGFIVAAANTSNAGTGREMLQGLDTLIQWNGQAGNRFYQRVNLDHVGSTGHSQGGAGAINAAKDPRVDTSFTLAGTTNMTGVHGPTFVMVGADDTLKNVVRPAYESATTIPAAYGELAGANHLTVLGNAGGFRGPTTAWARWQLMGDTTARNQFVGDSCALCTSSSWTYETNAEFRSTYGGGDPGPDPDPGECVTDTNSAHVQAGRATAFLIFAFARGTYQYLGLTSATTSLHQTAPDTWERVDACDD